MSTQVPLAIWPHTPPSPLQTELLARALAEIGGPHTVRPVGAVPGSPGVVLAFGELPPFAIEVAYISEANIGRYESVLAATRAALAGLSDEDARGNFGVLDFLNLYLPGTREITDPVELQFIADMDEAERLRNEAMAA